MRNNRLHLQRHRHNMLHPHRKISHITKTTRFFHYTFQKHRRLFISFRLYHNLLLHHFRQHLFRPAQSSKNTRRKRPFRSSLNFLHRWRRCFSNFFSTRLRSSSFAFCPCLFFSHLMSILKVLLVPLNRENLSVPS